MKLLWHKFFLGGGDQHNVVRVATRYALDSPGFEPRWGQTFPLPHTHTNRPWCPPGLLLFDWCRDCFPGAKRPEREDYPLNAASRLRMSAAVLCMPSWRGHWQLYRFTFPDYVIVWSDIPHSCVSFHQLHYLWHHWPKHHIHYFWINGNWRELRGHSNCDGLMVLSENISNGKSPANWTNDCTVIFFSSVTPNSALLNLTFPPLFVNTTVDILFRLLTVSRD